MRWLLFTLVLAGCPGDKDSGTDDSDIKESIDSTDDSGDSQNDIDADGDGATADVDCNDNDPAINPSATEVCDTVDNNCDGQTDEGTKVTFYADNDADSFGDDATRGEDCVAPTGSASQGGDCDDNNAAVNPNAVEVVDGVDNNCNGQTDEANLTRYYVDNDGDSYGDPNNYQDASSQPQGYVLDNTDCNDSSGDTHPGAAEICDGQDNDCNGQVDDNPTDQILFYEDLDGDGFGNPGVFVEACDNPGGYSSVAGDCDENDANVNPNATEVANGQDDNCDGSVDEGTSGTTRYYADADGDSYGDPAVFQDATSQPSGYVSNNGDCDDTNGGVYPGATETANNIDDNCDGLVDEGVGGTNTYYADADGDGYGDPNSSQSATSQPSGYVGNSNDCDDTDSAVNPAAVEVAGNSTDDNCNGQVDETTGGTTRYYEDADGDGYGNPTVYVDATAAPTGYTDVSDDCDDGDATTNPGAAEVADGVDNNCDGQTDEGTGNPTTWYEDLDGDGYGNPTASLTDTSQPAGYVADNTDCDDNNVTANLYAPEVCDGIDNDCDSLGDEQDPGLTDGTRYYFDSDGDSYGDPNLYQNACSYPTGLPVSTNGDDCDDSSASVNPGASEVVGNGIDDNCDGTAQ